MSEPAATPPDLPTSTPLPAPDPVGDVVPGDPPVPITVWHLPKPRQGAAVPTSVIRRLILNYTHPGAPSSTSPPASLSITEGNRPP